VCPKHQKKPCSPQLRTWRTLEITILACAVVTALTTAAPYRIGAQTNAEALNYLNNANGFQLSTRPQFTPHVESTRFTIKDLPLSLHSEMSIGRLTADKASTSGTTMFFSDIFSADRMRLHQRNRALNEDMQRADIVIFLIDIDGNYRSEHFGLPSQLIPIDDQPAVKSTKGISHQRFSPTCRGAGPSVSRKMLIKSNRSG
jgi:hypothetical protein